ncbi:hypothetical protein Tco_1570398 [Tanacetum coccineum]
MSKTSPKESVGSNDMVHNFYLEEAKKKEQLQKDQDFVMSDSEHSTFTYTSISSDDGSLDVGSSAVIVLGYDGLPMMPEDPYAYVKAAIQEPPPPNFVPEHVYPEFMPPEDDVLPAEEQPLPTAVSPTADSSGYIRKSDPEEDPEEEDDEDPEKDPTDYPTNKDDDDDEEESFGDEADDEEEDEGEDEEKEEEHLLRRLCPTNPHNKNNHSASIYGHDESCRTIHLHLSTSIRAPPLGTPPSGTPPLLPISLPTSSPPLLLPSTDYRADVLEVMLPPRKKLCITPGPRYKIGESSSAPSARPTGGFRADYDEIVEEISTTDVTELGQRMTDFVTTARRDKDEIFGRLDDA